MNLKKILAGLGGLLLPLATAGAMDLIINGTTFENVNSIRVHQTASTVTIDTDPILDLGGGGGGGGDIVYHTVSTLRSPTAGGSFSPTSRSVAAGSTTTFTVTAASGHQIDTVSGCSGSLSGSTYTTGAINAVCTVTANFTAIDTGGSSDPGPGVKWVTEFNGTPVYVSDRSAYSNRTYNTGCLSKNWPALNLSHNRSLNPFATTSVNTNCRGVGSVPANGIMSQRIPFRGGPDPISIVLGKAEAGETGGQVYDIAVARLPGDLDPPADSSSYPNSRCILKGVVDGTIPLMERSAWNALSSRTRGAYCPIEANTVYYFNSRPSPGTAGATSCGNGSYVCRTQVIDYIPADYYLDVRVKDEYY